jgi:hypothetical protein
LTAPEAASSQAAIPKIHLARILRLPHPLS